MAIREHLARLVGQLGPRDLVAVLYPLTTITALTFSRNHDGTATAMMHFEGRKYDYNPKNDYERQFDNMPPEVRRAGTQRADDSRADVRVHLPRFAARGPEDDPLS